MPVTSLFTSNLMSALVLAGRGTVSSTLYPNRLCCSDSYFDRENSTACCIILCLKYNRIYNGRFKLSLQQGLNIKKQKQHVLKNTKCSTRTDHICKMYSYSDAIRYLEVIAMLEKKNTILYCYALTLGHIYQHTIIL